MHTFSVDQGKLVLIELLRASALQMGSFYMDVTENSYLIMSATVDACGMFI